jgi:ferredoxin
MTYVVNENCIKCKYTDCVESCPVDCFYEHEHMLVINPEECIDCGVCEPECPVDAIKADTSPGASRWLSLNAQLAAAGVQITKRKDPPPDADRWRRVAGKYQLVFTDTLVDAPAGD